MKKLNSVLGAAVAALLALGMSACTTDLDNPAETPHRVKTADDFVAAVQAGGVVELVPGARITLEEGIALPADVQVYGDPEAPARITMGSSGLVTAHSVTLANVYIDAAALTTPLILFRDTTLAEGQQSVPIELISITGSRVDNLAHQLVCANRQRYLVGTIELDNSVIAVKGASKKTVFDFNGGGNVCNLLISHSTIWGDATSEWQNGGFYSSQSGQTVEDLGGVAQLTSITNSTIYNIAKGKTLSTRRKNSQPWMVYEVRHSIIADSGKEGEFLVGMNAGQKGKPENWRVEGNVFNFGGADSGEIEVMKLGFELNNVAAVVPFADAASGQFTQTAVQAGDSRWMK